MLIFIWNKILKTPVLAISGEEGGEGRERGKERGREEGREGGRTEEERRGV